MVPLASTYGDYDQFASRKTDNIQQKHLMRSRMASLHTLLVRCSVYYQLRILKLLLGDLNYNNFWVQVFSVKAEHLHVSQLRSAVQGHAYAVEDK